MRLKIRAGWARMSLILSMSEPKPENQSPANSGSIGAGDAKGASPIDATAPATLTKEEQWALFEKELKEEDWGHQPC